MHNQSIKATMDRNVFTLWTGWEEKRHTTSNNISCFFFGSTCLASWRCFRSGEVSQKWMSWICGTYFITCRTTFLLSNGNVEAPKVREHSNIISTKKKQATWNYCMQRSIRWCTNTWASMMKRRIVITVDRVHWHSGIKQLFCIATYLTSCVTRQKDNLILLRWCS